MKPSRYLFFPVRNGEWLRNSQGNPRVYKSAASAFRELECRQYDTMQIFGICDEMSREDFERMLKEGEENNG